MDSDFDSVFRDVYQVRLDHPPNVDVQPVLSSIFQVRLSLSILFPVGLKRPPVTHAQGAILEIPLDKEAAIELFCGIRKVAQTMGWLLPKEDEGLV